MTPENEAVLTLPVLPLKNTVLFPHLFMPLSVGRPNSVAAVEAVLASEDKNLILVAQRDAANESPGLDDLFTVGTRAVVKKMARGDGAIELLVQGVELPCDVQPASVATDYRHGMLLVHLTTEAEK